MVLVVMCEEQGLSDMETSKPISLKEC